MILLRSGSTSDSRIVYDETSNDTEPSELLLTSEGEPTNGSANLVLKSVTIDVSEDGKSVFHRPDEATNGFGSNNMDRDDFAPTFNLAGEKGLGKCLFTRVQIISPYGTRLF
eukprot:Gb_31874 [translate_table: standard]